MNPRRVIDSLKQLCSDIDAGRPLRRIDLRPLVLPLVVPAAIGLASLAYVGCTENTPLYGVPLEDNCTDGIDNDDDGDIDCDDLNCADDTACNVIPPYAGPFEDDCDDGIDNDDDGDIDCDDSECADDAACAVVTEDDCDDGADNDGDELIDCCDDDCAETDFCAAPSCPAYGGPWEEENCTDCRDDMDCDGLIDCDDPDCATDPACGATPPYAVPFEENCSDEHDDDGDGLTDCCDDDCAEDDFCNSLACPEYGGPWEEENCTDCRDGEDCDGLIDCDDPDCASDPACV